MIEIKNRYQNNLIINIPKKELFSVINCYLSYLIEESPHGYINGNEVAECIEKVNKISDWAELCEIKTVIDCTYANISLCISVPSWERVKEERTKMDETGLFEEKRDCEEV